MMSHCNFYYFYKIYLSIIDGFRNKLNLLIYHNFLINMMIMYHCIIQNKKSADYKFTCNKGDVGGKGGFSIPVSPLC